MKRTKRAHMSSARRTDEPWKIFSSPNMRPWRSKGFGVSEGAGSPSRSAESKKSSSSAIGAVALRGKQSEE